MSFVLTFGDVCIKVASRLRVGGHMPIDHSGNVDILAAFEGALKKLVVDRRSPDALVVAERLMTLAKSGVRDPMRLRDLTVRAVWIDWHGREHRKARALGRC